MRSAYFLAALSIVGETDMLMVVPRRLAQWDASDFNLMIFEAPLSLPRFSVFTASHERFANSALHRWLRRITTEALMEMAAASPATRL